MNPGKARRPSMCKTKRAIEVSGMLMSVEETSKCFSKNIEMFLKNFETFFPKHRKV
jgi:hypothetical protein